MASTEQSHEKYLELVRQGIILSYEENFTGSLAKFNDAIAMYPKKQYAYVRRGIDYLNFMQLDKAVRDFQYALENCDDVDESSRLLLLGLIAESRDQQEIAKTYYLKSLEIDPNNDYSLFSIAFVESNCKNNKVAIEYYLKALPFSKTPPCIIYNNIGWCYENLEDIQTASEYYNKSVETYPRCVKGLYNLAKYHLKKEDFQKALEYYTRLLEVNPTDVIVMCDVGDLYFYELNKPQDALKYYNKSHLYDITYGYPYVMLALFKVRKLDQLIFRRKRLASKHGKEKLKEMILQPSREALKIIGEGLSWCAHADELEQLTTVKHEILTRYVNFVQESKFFQTEDKATATSTEAENGSDVPMLMAAPVKAEGEAEETDSENGDDDEEDDDDDWEDVAELYEYHERLKAQQMNQVKLPKFHESRLRAKFKKELLRLMQHANGVLEKQDFSFYRYYYFENSPSTNSSNKNYFEVEELKSPIGGATVGYDFCIVFADIKIITE